VSMRSKGGVDVSQIASNFGGGGHRVASGCMVDGELDKVEKKVMEDIKARIKDESGKNGRG